MCKTSIHKGYPNSKLALSSSINKRHSFSQIIHLISFSGVIPSMPFPFPFYKLLVFSCNKVAIPTVIYSSCTVEKIPTGEKENHRVLESRAQTKENNHRAKRSLHRFVWASSGRESPKQAVPSRTGHRARSTALHT